MTTPTHEQKKNRELAEAARIRTAFRTAFRTEAGRTVLAHLQSSARCLPGSEQPSFLFTAGGPVCPYAAAFRDGRKSLLYEISSILATPEDAANTGPVATR